LGYHSRIGFCGKFLEKRLGAFLIALIRQALGALEQSVGCGQSPARIIFLSHFGQSARRFERAYFAKRRKGRFGRERVLFRGQARESTHGLRTTVLRSALIDNAVSSHRFDDSPALGHRQGNGLLAVDVFAGLGRLDGDHGMPMIEGGDQDYVVPV